MTDLTDETPLDLERLWGAMRTLLERLGGDAEIDALLAGALDLLIDVLGADRGLIWCLTADGLPYPIQARSWQRRLTPQEQAEISRTTVQRVLETGDCVCQEGEAGDASGSMFRFGIGGVLAGPLRPVAWREIAIDAAEALPRTRMLRGVVYLDFRSPQHALTGRHLEFFQAALALLALVLDHHALVRLARTSGGTRDNAGRERVEAVADLRLEDLLGPSSQEAVRRQLLPVVRSAIPVLLLGESGTGKTQLARAIAAGSDREAPFVRVNLGRLDDRNAVISELFGHVKGSYTGAVSDRIGKVERADGGTLFLDEILNLPYDVQPLLLDLLQDGTYEPLGWNSTAPKRARVRIIAATNGDIGQAIRTGEFREDLYYRLAGCVVRLVPLRERREDIPVLAEHYLRRADPGRAWRLSPALRAALTGPGLRWEGNLRQLHHLLDRGMARAMADDAEALQLAPAHLEPLGEGLAPGTRLPAFDEQAIARAAARLETARTVLNAQDLSKTATRLESARMVLDEQDLSGTASRLKEARAVLDGVERRMLELALERNRGVVAWAAESIGMPRTGFASRLQTLGMDAEVPRRRRRRSG